MPTNRVLISNN